MNVDRYTKAVLTVIAGCLLWMCVMSTGPALQAQRQRDRERDPDSTLVDLREIKTTAQPVILVGTGTMDRQGNIEVTFNQRDNTRRTDPSLAVRLPYSATNPMAVEITPSERLATGTRSTPPWTMRRSGRSRAVAAADPIRASTRSWDRRASRAWRAGNRRGARWPTAAP